jgi:adenylylsulfate kinase
MEYNSNPIPYDLEIVKELKEKQIRQRGHVFWMTGLSGAGKTTLANEAAIKLLKKGYICQVLDGDIIRNSINKDLGFSTDDRNENIRRVAEIGKILISNGIILIVSMITPRQCMRALARGIIGDCFFSEVYVNAPIDVCEKRDVKGLYANVRAGRIKNFTGIDDAYQEPIKPDITIQTSVLSQAESVSLLYKFIHEKIKY